MTSLLATADLVVLPSLVFETQGLALIEAMSCGTPAIATSVGWPRRDAGRLSRPAGATRRRAALAAAMDRSVGWRRHSPAWGIRLTPLGG